MSSKLLSSPMRSRRNGDSVDHALAERRQAVALDRVDAALRDDIGALPIVAAVEHDHHLAGLDVPAGLIGVAVLRRDSRNHSTSIGAPMSSTWQAGALAHGRMAAVAADDQGGADLEFAVRVSWRARRRRGRLPRSGRWPRSACADGSRIALGLRSARKSRKSHCGISATNLQCAGRWLKSTIGMRSAPIWNVRCDTS